MRIQKSFPPRRPAAAAATPFALCTTVVSNVDTAPAPPHGRPPPANLGPIVVPTADKYCGVLQPLSMHRTSMHRTQVWCAASYA